MGPLVVLRFARGAIAVCVIATASALAVAAPAIAATSTITTASLTAVPEQAVPVDLTFSGTNNQSGSAEVEAVVRPAGGLSCQSSYQDDLAAVGSVDQVIFAPGSETVAAGQPYQVDASYKPPAVASYQVCAWLAENQGGTDAAVAGPSALSFTTQGPQVVQLTVAVAKPLIPSVAFQIAYTTQTDQSLALYSVIEAAPPVLPAGSPATPACLSSFEGQLQEDVGTILLGPGAQGVFGGPTTTTVTDTEKAGAYVICTWVEGPSYREVDATATTPVTVGTVPPPPSQLRLSLTKVTASRRHGVSVSGKTASAFSGRLVLLAACGSSTASHAVTADHGRFSGRLGLASGCRSAKRVKVTVSWAGSPSFAKQSIRRSVVIRK
ncbi:MAG TPA: hypothetical protein VME22_21035 [Solirubrobacteraceae bacterium]|nr:hypothetical protein [Solirubrobacteraceae bacterium]